jgi:hypothetical protein
MGYSWGRRRSGRSRWGRTLSHRFGRRVRGKKNKYNKINRGIRRPPINDCTQQPTKFTPEQLRGDSIEREVVEERWGMANPSFWGQSSWEGGEKHKKIDAFIKLIIFLARSSNNPSRCAFRGGAAIYHHSHADRPGVRLCHGGVLC